MNWVERTKRNHAIEHTVIAIMASRMSHAGHMLAGYATAGGFYIFGNVQTEEVCTAAAEAAERLSRGEKELAISPFCGTNIVVGTLLMALGLSATTDKARLLRSLPYGFLLYSVGSLAIAKPLGQLVQKYVTTYADISGFEVTNVLRWQLGPVVIHKVYTRQLH